MKLLAPLPRAVGVALPPAAWLAFTSAAASGCRWGTLMPFLRAASRALVTGVSTGTELQLMPAARSLVLTVGVHVAFLTCWAGVEGAVCVETWELGMLMGMQG